jgi:hypothetical protein
LLGIACWEENIELNIALRTSETARAADYGEEVT